MSPLRVRVHIAARAPANTDDDEAHALKSLVLRSIVDEGKVWSGAVAIRPHRRELLDLQSLRGSATGLAPFLAGLTRSTPEDAGAPLAVGVCGRFLWKRPTGVVPVALVFLEWPDCRWWHWQVALGAEGQPVPDGETVRRAVDGDPMPPGLGRWWSAGRRLRAEVRFGPLERSGVETSPLVH